MLNRIKNSLLCKYLQVLLIGYFLISSINLSNSVVLIINNNTEVHSVKGIACNFLKKMFKCDRISEELDEYEKKDSKTTKLAKGMPSLDYIVPLDTSVPGLHFQTKDNRKNYQGNPLFSFGFYGKIYLRPPLSIV